MAKIINITDKMDFDQPKLVIGGKEYDVQNSVKGVLKFDEELKDLSVDSFTASLTVALGEEAVKELKVTELSFPNLKILMIAVLALMQDMSYEDADARFQGTEEPASL